MYEVLREYKYGLRTRGVSPETLSPRTRIRRSQKITILASAVRTEIGWRHVLFFLPMHNISTPNLRRRILQRTRNTFIAIQEILVQILEVTKVMPPNPQIQ